MMQSKIAENKRNTLVIMALFVGVIAAIGWVASKILGQTSALYFIVGGSLLYVLVQYFMADKFALMSTGAQQIAKQDNPRLWNMVQELSTKTNLPMPRVYIVNDSAPNAFATGRDPKRAVVAATTGILEVMDDRELKAVLAHEMSHVKNYDIRVSMIAFGLSSVIGALGNMLSWNMMMGSDEEDTGPAGMIFSIVMIVIAPIAAMLIQMAISRQREYLADASGAEAIHDPEGLARALEKLRDFGQPMQQQNAATAHLYISNPLTPGMVASLFSTHPPLDDRIARLRGTKARGNK